MFNKDSYIVKLWVRMVKSNMYDISEVPELYNLKEVVTGIIDPIK